MVWSLKTWPTTVARNNVSMRKPSDDNDDPVYFPSPRYLVQSWKATSRTAIPLFQEKRDKRKSGPGFIILNTLKRQRTKTQETMYGITFISVLSCHRPNKDKWHRSRSIPNDCECKQKVSDGSQENDEDEIPRLVTLDLDPYTHQQVTFQLRDQSRWETLLVQNRSRYCSHNSWFNLCCLAEIREKSLHCVLFEPARCKPSSLCRELALKN